MTPCNVVECYQYLGGLAALILCAEDRGSKFPRDVGNILLHYMVSYARRKFVRWRFLQAQVSSSCSSSFFSSSSSFFSFSSLFFSFSSSSLVNLSLFTGFLYQQFEVSTVMTVKTTVFWNVMPCSLLDVYHSS